MYNLLKNGLLQQSKNILQQQELKYIKLQQNLNNLSNLKEEDVDFLLKKVLITLFISEYNKIDQKDQYGDRPYIDNRLVTIKQSLLHYSDLEEEGMEDRYINELLALEKEESLLSNTRLNLTANTLIDVEENGYENLEEYLPQLKEYIFSIPLFLDSFKALELMLMTYEAKMISSQKVELIEGYFSKEDYEKYQFQIINSNEENFKTLLFEIEQKSKYEFENKEELLKLHRSFRFELKEVLFSKPITKRITNLYKKTNNQQIKKVIVFLKEKGFNENEIFEKVEEYKKNKEAVSLFLKENGMNKVEAQNLKENYFLDDISIFHEKVLLIRNQISHANIFFESEIEEKEVREAIKLTHELYKKFENRGNNLFSVPKYLKKGILKSIDPIKRRKDILSFNQLS